MCIYIIYIHIYNVVISLPFKSCGRPCHAMPPLLPWKLLHLDHPRTKFPLHPALIKWNWSRPERLDVSELVRIGWRKDKWISPGRKFEKGWICCLTCHIALPRMEDCWHLLTSVDCKSYERSTYYERQNEGLCFFFLCPALLIERHQGGTTIRKSGTAKQHLISTETSETVRRNASWHP